MRVWGRDWKRERNEESMEAVSLEKRRFWRIAWSACILLFCLELSW